MYLVKIWVRYGHFHSGISWVSSVSPRE